MQESLLTSWAAFYTIVGAASATLTGLMFVGISLVTRTQGRRPDQQIAAFSTPTIVHFCVALAVAATLSAPWHVLWHAGLPLGLSGFGGVAYTGVVVRRMIRQAVYQPVLEDWLWHITFPLIVYVALVVAALRLSSQPQATLFVVGAAVVMLLFIGIHNAWDNITYIVVDTVQRSIQDSDEPHPDNVPVDGQAETGSADTGVPIASAPRTTASQDGAVAGAGDTPRHPSPDPSTEQRFMSHYLERQLSLTSRVPSVIGLVKMEKKI